MLFELIPQPAERRQKPRIKPLANGSCLLSFSFNGWLVFDNLPAAYWFLNGDSFRQNRHRKNHNTQW